MYISPRLNIRRSTKRVIMFHLTTLLSFFYSSLKFTSIKGILNILNFPQILCIVRELKSFPILCYSAKTHAFELKRIIFVLEHI